jgi:hypothetical protein
MTSCIICLDLSVSASLISISISLIFHPHPHPHPSTLPDPSFHSVHPSPTMPLTAQLLKPADQRWSAYQVAQQVEVTRTLAHMSRLMIAPSRLTLAIYSLVSAFYTLSFCIPSYFSHLYLPSFVLVHIIILSILLPSSLLMHGLLTHKLPFVRLDIALDFASWTIPAAWVLSPVGALLFLRLRLYLTPCLLDSSLTSYSLPVWMLYIPLLVWPWKAGNPCGHFPHSFYLCALSLSLISLVIISYAPFLG